MVKILEDVGSKKNAFSFASFELDAFFKSNTFISNARLKLAKNQAKAKQHPETELLLFEDYFLYPSYHTKIKGDILKNIQKTYVCLNEVV